MALGGNTAELVVDLKFDDSKAAAALQGSLQGLTRQTQNFNKNPIIAKNFTQPLGRITGAADEFTKSLEASNARVLAFGASAGAIFAVQKAMSELVKTTISVEQALTDINVLLGASNKDFKRFSDGLFQVARQTGTAFDQVADSANEFARQGLGVEETLKRTQAALALSKLGMMDSVNATESLTAALNTFKGEVDDATLVVNKLAQVDADFAVSSKDLAEAIKRTGSSAQGAKVSFEELLAVVTVTQERTARGGAVIGNAFKTIFTRVQRPEVLNNLASIGIAVRDQAGETLPAIQILRNYAKAYDSLSPALKSNTAQLIAGGRQINILQSLLPDLASSTSQFDAALRTANETTTEATDRLKILTSTTQGTLNAVQANLVKTASEIGTLSIKPAIDNILGALDGIASLVGPSNFLGLGETIGKGVYEGIGKVISGPGILLLGAVLAKLGANLLKFVSTSGAQFLGLNKQAEEQARTQTIISNLLAQRPNDIQRILSGQVSVNDAAKVFGNELRMAEAHYEKLNALAAQLAAKQRTFGGPSRKKTNAEGLIPNFVPNFAMADAEAERQAASQGGYRAGQVRRMNMPGMGPVTYNGKEKVKQFPGMQQPAIMPPALSSAGKDYRNQFKSVIGFDPYNEGAAFGFVPNFSTKGLGRKTHYDFLSTSEKKNLDSRSGPDQRAFWAGLPQERKDQLMMQSGGKTVGQAKSQEKALRVAAAKGGDVDVQQKLGILSLLGTSQKNAETSTSLGKLSVFNDILNDKKALNAKERKILSNAPVTFRNVQVSSLTDSSDSIAKDKNHPRFKNFKKSLNQNIVPLVSSLSSATFGNLLGNQRATEAEIMTQLKGVDIIPESTEGELFETAARFATRDTAAFKKAVSGDLNAPFDFEEGGNAATVFKDAFFGSQDGFNPAALVRADAKRTASPGSIRSVINKSFNRQVANMAQKTKAEVLDDLGLPFLGGNISVLSDKGAKVSYTGKRGLNNPIAENKKKAALGLVPNFSLKGISDAIKREDRSVRSDKIRVGYDRRLAASGGIGVYNTDEGSLGNAINMHMAAGRNKSQIQRQGKAGGFVPNFLNERQREARRTSRMPGSFDALNQIPTGGGTFRGASRTAPTFGGSSVGGGALNNIATNANQAAAKIKTLETSAEQLTFDFSDSGSSSKAATSAKKEETKATNKNTQEKKKNTKGTKDLNDISLQASFAISLAAGGMATFGDRLKENENNLISMTGQLISATSTLAMYVPTLMTINQMMAGGFAGGLGRFSKFLKMDVGKTLVGGGTGLGRRQGLLQKAKGVPGRVGAMMGVGATGGAVGIGVAAAGAVGYALYQNSVKKAQEATDKLASSVEKSAKQYDDLQEALGTSADISKQYAEAINVADLAKQKAIRNELAQSLAQGDVLNRLNKAGLSGQDIINKVVSGNVQAIEKLKKELDIARNVEVLGESLAITFRSLRDVDKGTGLERQEAGINAIVDAFTKAFDADKAQELATGMQKLFDLGEKLRPVGNDKNFIRDVRDDFEDVLANLFGVGGDRPVAVEALTVGLRDYLKVLNISEEEQAMINSAIADLGDGMNDETTQIRILVNIIAALNARTGSLLEATTGVGNALNILKNRVRDFEPHVLRLQEIFDDTAKQLKLKKDLQDILQDGSDKLFKQGADSLKSNLSKIAGSKTVNRLENMTNSQVIQRQQAAKQADINAKFNQDVLKIVQESFALQAGATGAGNVMGLSTQFPSSGELLKIFDKLIVEAQSGTTDPARIQAEFNNALAQLGNASAELQNSLNQQLGKTGPQQSIDRLGESLRKAAQDNNNEISKSNQLFQNRNDLEKQRVQLQKESLFLQQQINSTLAVAVNPTKFMNDLQKNATTNLGLALMKGDAGGAQEARVAAARQLSQFRLGDFNPAEDLFGDDLFEGFKRNLQSMDLGLSEKMIEKMAQNATDSILKPNDLKALQEKFDDLTNTIKTPQIKAIDLNTRALDELRDAINKEAGETKGNSDKVSEKDERMINRLERKRERQLARDDRQNRKNFNNEFGGAAFVGDPVAKQLPSDSPKIIDGGRARTPNNIIPMEQAGVRRKGSSIFSRAIKAGRAALPRVASVAGRFAGPVGAALGVKDIGGFLNEVITERVGRALTEAGFGTRQRRGGTGLKLENFGNPKPPLKPSKGTQSLVDKILKGTMSANRLKEIAEYLQNPEKAIQNAQDKATGPSSVRPAVSALMLPKQQPQKLPLPEVKPDIANSLKNREVAEGAIETVPQPRSIPLPALSAMRGTFRLPKPPKFPVPPPFEEGDDNLELGTTPAEKRTVTLEDGKPRVDFEPLTLKKIIEAQSATGLLGGGGNDGFSGGKASSFAGNPNQSVAGLLLSSNQDLKGLMQGEGFDEPQKLVAGIVNAVNAFGELDKSLITATTNGVDASTALGIRNNADRQQVELQRQLSIGTIDLSEYTAQLSAVMAEAGNNVSFFTAKQLEANAQSQFNANQITTTELLAAAQDKLNKSYHDGEKFAEALNDSIGARFQYNAATFRKQSGELVLGVVDDFKGGVKSAFGEAIRGTASLREAFATVFDKILDNILDKSLDMGVDSLFGAVGGYFGVGKAKGGLIKGYNAGGFVNQGSGVRDDVPAMMQGGEYVIRKSSVNKYGRGLFDSLNSGGRVGYAMGDRVMQNRLRPEFVYNDPKRPTGGSYINTQGLSAFALMESNSPMIAIQREREKTLEQYIKDKAAYDEMVRKAQEQFKKQQKARFKKMLISAGLQVASPFIADALSGLGGVGTPHSDPKMAGHDVFGDPMFDPKVYEASANMTDTEVMSYLGLGNAKGGLIKAFARGGRNRDNIPAMLMGGEYVVNKQSVDKYGVGLFNDLNNGRAQGFANGGMVGGDGGGVGGAPTTANNNFEINITMNGNGEGETTTSSNQNENQSQEDQERNEQLGMAVKNAVQTELIEQQRPGGLLYREDRI